MLSRLKNPAILAAMLGFVYQLVNTLTQKYYGLTIDVVTWNTFFNLLSFVLIGVGIYTVNPTQMTKPDSSEGLTTILLPNTPVVSNQVTNTSVSAESNWE